MERLLVVIMRVPVEMVPAGVLRQAGPNVVRRGVRFGMREVDSLVLVIDLLEGKWDRFGIDSREGQVNRPCRCCSLLTKVIRC